MQFKLGVLIVLMGYVLINAADDPLVLTAQGIKQNVEIACQNKNFKDALKWFHVAGLFFAVDYCQLDSEQRKKFISINEGIKGEMRKIWPTKFDARFKLREYLADKKKTAAFVLSEIEANRVQVDLSELLDGDKLPGDKQLKEGRIVELKKICSMEPPCENHGVSVRE